MINPKKIEQIAEQISELIPPQVKTVADNVEEKVKTLLQAKLAQLDVVSREEFDVQTHVLAKTREKVQQLEKIVMELQQQQQPKSESDS